MVVQRARLQQSQALRGVVLVLGALVLLVCVALILDLMLTKVGRAKDIASIIQSFAAAADQRQLLLPVDDNYSCRSSGVTIWYRRYRIGHRSAGNGTEAEANGRQESASVGRSIGDERADGTDVADRQAAIGEEGQETVANSTGPVRRGMGRGGRAPSAGRR